MFTYKIAKKDLSQNLLKKAKKSAVNFHPASPDYPGIGCNNFALYDNAYLYNYNVWTNDQKKKADDQQ